MILGSNDSCFWECYLHTRNICYCMAGTWQICLKLLWKIQILRNFEWSEDTSGKKNQGSMCKFSLSSPKLTEPWMLQILSAPPIAELGRGMVEAARSPHPTSQEKLFLSVRQNPAPVHSPLWTNLHPDVIEKEGTCQVLADGRSRKRFTTLEYKTMFLEQLLASHIVCLLFFCLQTQPVLCCVDMSQLLLHSLSWYLPSSVQIVYPMTACFVSPPLLFLIFNCLSESSRFFYFSPCSAGFSQQ